MSARAAAATVLLALLAACQTGGSGATPSGTPSQERPQGVPQSTISDGDIDGDDGI